jgi:hypothetical protein
MFHLIYSSLADALVAAPSALSGEAAVLADRSRSKGSNCNEKAAAAYSRCETLERTRGSKAISPCVSAIAAASGFGDRSRSPQPESDVLSK